MIKYFQSKKKLRDDIKSLNEKLASTDNRVTKREQEKHFTEKMEMIKRYEAKIIKEAEEAADSRELSMLEIIEKKEDRIKELELEVIELRSSYRKFKAEVREHEALTHELNIDVQSTMTIIRKLSGKFEAMEYRMGRVAERVDKKDTKLVEQGKN